MGVIGWGGRCGLHGRRVGGAGDAIFCSAVQVGGVSRDAMATRLRERWVSSSDRLVSARGRILVHCTC